MNPTSLIPTPDTIPAPAWLFWLLGIVMFTLHILVINALLGSSIIMLFGRLAGKKPTMPKEFAGNVAVKSMALFAFGINLGVAALLFLQVLYGHFMYTSSVLMAVYWILVVPLLIIAYYAGYMHIRLSSKAPLISVLSLIVSTGILLYIGFTFVNNMTLMLMPEKWTAYFANRGGTVLNTSDPIFWPRYLHFLVASMAVGGLFLAFVQNRNAKKGIEGAEKKKRAGLKIFAWATCVQVLIGLWFLIALPKEIMMSFMGGNLIHTIILALGVLLALGAIYMGFRGKLAGTAYHLLGIILLMVINRSNLRALYLKDVFSFSSLELNPQYGVLALFLLVFVIGLGVVYYMIKIVLRANQGRATS